MSHQILTIGAATRDIFLVSNQFISLANKSFEGGRAECVSLGAKIDVQTFVATTGGGATNAAATFRALGFKTAAMCKIGDDSVGKEILAELRDRRIETAYVNRIAGGQTAYSTLLTMPQGERTVLVYRGVSATFKREDIHWSAIRKASWIYLTSLGGNFELSKEIIEFAHKHRVHVAWNPGNGELKKGSKAFTPLLAHVDIFLLNKEEAELLTGESQTKRQCKLLAHPEHIRLITNGARGTTVLHGSVSHSFGTSGAKSISRTGAGDAFGSGFVAGFLKYKDPVRAARIGTRNAESVIQHYGAKKGVLQEWPSDASLKKIKAL